MKQKGFAGVYILIGFLILAVVAGGGAYYLTRSNLSSIQPQPLLSVTLPKQLQPSATQTEMMKGAINKLHLYLHQYYAENKIYPTKLDQLVGVYSANMINNISITDKSINYTPSLDLKSYVLEVTLSNGENYTGSSEAQNKIFDSVIQFDIKQTQIALESYFYDQKIYPSKLSILMPSYISKLHKTNPYTFKDYDYKVSLDKKSYILITELANGQIYKVTNPD